MFDILNFEDFDFCIEDIAHSLSNICRYNGHTKRFYSVAEHSILVSKQLPEHLQLTGLLHDSTEAYIMDIPRPFKHICKMNEIDFSEVELRLFSRLASKFGLVDPLPSEVKEADLKMLSTEYRDLMKKNNPDHWEGLPEPYDINEIINQDFAYRTDELFLFRYRELTEWKK